MMMATDMAPGNDCLAMNLLLLLDTAAITYPSNISCNESAIANHCSDGATATAPSKEMKNQKTAMARKHASCNGSCRGKKKATAIEIGKQTAVMTTNMAPGNPCLVINQLLLLDTAAATYSSNISCNESAIANCCSDVATATATANK